ncbi:HAD family hydrolase [Rhodococcus sp. ACPA1]|uniref:HAD family hydrolase n=1 Tax=Rhodococcus sp. ACPA1 TaxID=2028572 RepID=UPI000BB15B11|nr:HAD family hydrolase [Rhodococcus sp. ACPA1]PBC56853.1 HAD family hydrolase [Rhodococcus sp. ACPA1]RZK84187.1 MAG: HAD family hydrolase [Rhodococcus sp. (in: high G+C Gram-positive bacteria)]
MTALIATDLDRTMIYSRGAMELAVTESDVAERPGDEDLLCVEVYDGKPLSYVTSAAEAMLRRLTASAVVVPTTTRTVAQFQRIDLPGAPWRYAITTNGGNILVDGVPDAGWRSGVDIAMAGRGASLVEVGAELSRRIDDGWVRSSRVADELFSYLVVDLDAMPAGFVEEWNDWCVDRGWGVSRQGRKIYTMPDAVCKSRAVAEVRSRLVDDGVLAPEAPVLAAGDGALDANMLSAADAAIRPRHGELETIDWQHPTLSVTGSSGIAAGEEILRWFADRVARGAGTTAVGSLL